ncbi:serine-protein kinase ATM-like [Pseudoliparis swirei]|uniref:serine-protein kinase ATM-like n=1 Tax=Pseudoliparis swirei TaxID=2059687 RepID=UPI0024BE6DD4|nr:serine-protein kinase ATM-like [Pseudoliparis swirei]
MTFWPKLLAARFTKEALNMVYSDSMSPSSLGKCEKFFQRKSGVVSRALKWLFCTAWHNSVEIAPPGQASLCIRKHLRLRGDASRKETRRTASSEQTVEVLEGLTTMMKKSMTMSMRGRDDLRQDAVMQQVFSMCSMLLQRNTDTRKRKLNIRRYKVVPFTQRSGVLEWCSGTVPIGDFLLDPIKGAHKRFRPRDPTNLACRKKMMEAQKLAFDGKLQAYSEVCKNFRPVFRYFCMERFLDPAVWMEKRLAYTRSVATSSIVGYIVGLGDRHNQNILVDEQTAELVHIDLGVAFEQGKILPTPETVPFRLSRDIVDGMGITGVEGVFRRCCEKTMEVMRSSQEALLTIVEVLLYDPLFDWTMNPLKAFYLQLDEQQELNATLASTMGGDDVDNHRKSSDSQNFNKVAKRVLLRLQDKLKGVEEGTVLSVGGQVNLLIQQAMDPKNLSRLFPGWQAWV